ncbi:hypothetical protein HYT33_00405 [Candidatus Roizmanbacteria bacterium]|nr:hypothetical protein [Candidatus Roizmanbacteria bacterium]
MKEGILPFIFTFITNNIGEYSSLYFYSALFQGNAALITLSAMFVIYKSQSLENKFAKIEEMLLAYFKRSFNLVMNYKDIWSLENYDEKLFGHLDGGTINNIKETIQGVHWKARFVELRLIQRDINKLWVEASPALKGIFYALILSIVLLPFSNLLHKHIYLELLLFILIIILEVISIKNLYIFIRKQLTGNVISDEY